MFWIGVASADRVQWRQVDDKSKWLQKYVLKDFEKPKRSKGFFSGGIFVN